MSRTVQDLVQKIQKSEARVSECEAALKAAQEAKHAGLVALRVFLGMGETTGNRLVDLVVRAGGWLNDPILPKVRELEARLKGKEGEFVLIHWSGEARTRFGGSIREGDFEHREFCRIGILAAEELKLVRGSEGSLPSIALPVVDRFLNGRWAYSFMATTFEEKPVEEAGDFFEWTGDEQPPTLTKYLVDESLAKNLLIGDDEVRTALKASGDEEKFAEAAERLGRLVLQPTS